jgi:hypothetical protein
VAFEGRDDFGFADRLCDVVRRICRVGFNVEIDAALGGELDGAEVSVGAIGKIGGIGKA